MRVIAIHLLNDFSGSPKVLMQLLKCWTKNNIQTTLYTSGGREGFLSGLKGVNYQHYWYPFVSNKIVRLFIFCVSQILLAIKLSRQLKKNDVLYINTVLPFGAGCIGKLKKCKVIYHVHETSIKPLPLKKFLFCIARWSATEMVYVSNFLAHEESSNTTKRILYNVLEKDFVTLAKLNQNYPKKDIVLMLCSLKNYKGIPEFIQIAKDLPKFTFKLILNATETEISNYFKNKKIPNNLELYPTQKETYVFYREAKLVLNLSDVNQWVETFGLTILEGMAFGLPAIVPPVGGITELIENNYNGYQINSKKINEISKTINNLLENKNLYSKLSANALQKSKQFEEHFFEKAALSLVLDWN